MEGETEDPTGYPPVYCPLELKPAKLGEGVCHHGMFIAGQSVVGPLNPQVLFTPSCRLQEANQSD